jgi:hypothetical protein
MKRVQPTGMLLCLWLAAQLDHDQIRQNFAVAAQPNTLRLVLEMALSQAGCWSDM